MTDAKSMRIVIVEDETLIATLIGDALGAAGHEVLGVADSVADAVSLVDRTSPDLVLCDVKLFNGDTGLDVAAALHERGVPCLFVSGACPTPDLGRGMAIGCLLKPFRPSRLEEAVQAALMVSRGQTPERLPTGMIVY